MLPILPGTRVAYTVPGGKTLLGTAWSEDILGGVNVRFDAIEGHGATVLGPYMRGDLVAVEDADYLELGSVARDLKRGEAVQVGTSEVLTGIGGGSANVLHTMLAPLGIPNLTVERDLHYFDHRYCEVRALHL